MKIFVSTGEVSGDLHLSYLVKEAKDLDKNVEFYGVAGKHSKNAGVNIIQDIDELAIMGFTEAIKKYSYLKNKAEEYLDFIKRENIKKVIMVDYGGFNLKFLELLKKEIKDVEIFYYIPPKLWIWGEKRIDKLKLADHIMVIFPWEVDFYKKHNVNAIYYGNPFTERYKKVDRTGNKILLLPGSRKQEIKSLMPDFINLVKRNPNEKYLLKLSSKEHLKWIDENLTDLTNLEVCYDISLNNSVRDSKIAIAASGTVTLELALLGIPTIVVYKTNFINYVIAKYILKVGFVSLPNLTLNEEVFPELLQKKCNSVEIEKSMKTVLENLDSVQEKIQRIREKLSGVDITKRYAEFLLKGK
ncbi:lipid-A-disaccharide synthase [Cetobacterium somerae]|uniref:lipid-A-disaccharide synthase n=1 Tax=Cetobacterium somerae TaxID=188913 RepID=UPI00225138F6|nr:lipid-A-disaccharide synthase [Cetobacterium somerae]MCX3066116.1 lipid-A-disaccharide synthase [Cetobacterium somerae]